MKFLWLASLLLSLPAFASMEGPRLKYGNFGKFELFSKGKPDRLVILFSDRAGWVEKDSELARQLMDEHTAVAGVNLPAYEKTLERLSKKCLYPAGDLELLSKFLQAHLKFREYRPPLLIGLEEGGSLAYASLAQAPRATFTAAVSVGFCPSVDTLKMYCKGYGLGTEAGGRGKGFLVKPFDGSDSLPWEVLQGKKQCEAEAFVKKVDGASFSGLEPSASALKVEIERLLPEGKPVSTNSATAAPSTGHLAELPLVVVPAAEGKSSDEFVVFYSGDGGWAGFDQELAASLADRGDPIVGLSTLKYFWSAKDPAVAAKDLDAIIHYYADLWKKKSVRLVGYSFGADVMPELASRLPEATRKMVRGVHLLGLSETAEFEFHFESWLGDSGKGLPVKPALAKIVALKPQCLYGEEETDSLCAALDPNKFRVVKLPGGHHFGGDSETLAKIILGPEASAASAKP